MKKFISQNSLKSFSPVLVFLFFILSGFYHPTPKGEVRGRITNALTNKGIPLVTISLRIHGTSTFSSTKSDATGSFYFQNLTPGVYSGEVYTAGFKKKSIKEITVVAGKISWLNLTLSPEDAGNKKRVEVLSIPSTIKETEENVNNKEDYLKSTRTREKTPGAKSVTGSLYNQTPIEDFNREGYDYIDENEFHPAFQVPLSTFSIDVDRASYANVRRFINQGTLPPIDAVRIEELINYFSYQYKQPKAEDPFSIHTELIRCPWNKSHQLALIGLQGKEVQLDVMPPSNLVFLIDVSGSMNSPDKLPLLKRSLELLVNKLRPQDRVALVVYAGSAGLCLPSTSGNNKEKITEAINNLSAGGSTAGGAGINLAYKVAFENFKENGNNRVILATDGDFNVGVSSDGELIRLIEEKRSLGIFLTVLGFGTGNYQDAKMEKLADKGNGNYAYIDNIMEANKTLVTEMGGTLLTIAKDVKLQVEFNPAQVKEYKLIGYENRLLNARDFNDDSKDAGELGSGHTVTALYEIIPVNEESTNVTVDPLKYQLNYQISNTGNSIHEQELFTVKFRYKKPDGDKSKLIVHVVNNETTPFNYSSENIRFASAVAAFGMLLRNSKFKGTADYKMVLSMANDAKGKDSQGYRAEFIRLVETAKVLSRQTASED